VLTRWRKKKRAGIKQEKAGHVGFASDPFTNENYNTSGPVRVLIGSIISRPGFRSLASGAL
jgi:hypothetical protein